MIKYQCDGCGTEVEHKGPDLPAKWVCVGLTMHAMDAKGDAGEDSEEDTAAIFCPAPECGGDPDALWDIALERLRTTRVGPKT